MTGDEVPDTDVVVVYGDVCIRKERKKRRKVILWELLYEFSRTTTLHGVRYVTEKGLSIFEKIFWFITFIASVSVCFIHIYYVYEKWQSTPVVVTISENLVSVTTIPFPSITICPQIKCMASIYNYSAEYKKVKENITTLINAKYINETYNDEWLKKFTDISTVCNNNIIPFAYLNSLTIDQELANASLVKNLEEVTEPLKYSFYCKWRGLRISCRKYFKKVLTQEGVCYNMNAMAINEILKLENVQSDYNYSENYSPSKGWHPINGYMDRTRSPYPRRGRVNGAAPDLDVILRTDTADKDTLCNSLNDGYKIYMQHPADLPRSSLYYYAAIDDQVTSLAVKCSIMNTSSELLNKSPDQRKCYFEGERFLTYFKTYTANNCWLECLSNYTFKMCGCVRFHMPHNDSNQICSYGHYLCTVSAEERLANKEDTNNTMLHDTLNNCNCLPACYTIDYHAEVLKTTFDIRTLLNNYYDEPVDSSDRFTRIVVFFQEPRFVSMRRSELYGKIDFIANCGGLLGLFLGFSFLSVIEIIYFITIRLWCSLRRDLKQEKKRARKNIKNS